MSHRSAKGPAPKDRPLMFPAEGQAIRSSTTGDAVKAVPGVPMS
ncbi:hypothetical protein M2283_004668 [Streptomyces pseudovenezuelae]|uniref:Uncharacterized protein n=1 Tax=Streptomyces pseudovenezuelae TaxID=67350 RepID=A0ABT6LM01_9ACTN|nr:hypothetical protein [Streptomyces pseudovenezuelae]